ncbi:uncharacterized protein MONBRDRAFT_32329 [Monosiga brevicollis MX1]|uniref:Activator of Hsp90 ATPase AHSA1-like N-terminal domain-containing protein n=1 Tax=Monosiga brevicollis TaxID=81824 RepID=A9UYU5_MONBE|nr:uncharacterized protein MONBRDRAFT_32329 [Monosiga brevicollis MX1]EDQ89667.1 predicted protein [Monosiga brevicollis MX1]|eukprot:XP_001745696.1 hypothetical protein [Monosiga brevicollis MX1]
MAKWGEGDPRWIVEERPDAKNPGNWHWSEKDATAWSKNRLKELLSDLLVESDAGSARTTEVTVTGEATANNRKAKLIFFYELVIDIKWRGKTADGQACSGKIKVPNLSEEYDIDEVDTEVTMTSDSNKASDAVKSLLRERMPAIVVEQLHKWYRELTQEYSTNLVLPTKQATAAAATSVSAPTTSKDAGAGDTSKPNTGVKIHSQKTNGAGNLSCKSFSIRDTIPLPAQLIFETLMNEDRVSAYTQSQCKVDSRIGGSFTMFNGSVKGVIKDLVPYRRVHQAWRFESWPEGHYSDVVIDLSEAEGKTSLSIQHSEVPESDIERTQDGWRRLQLEPLKAMLGVGGMPFM